MRNFYLFFNNFSRALVNHGNRIRGAQEVEYDLLCYLDDVTNGELGSRYAAHYSKWKSQRELIRKDRHTGIRRNDFYVQLYLNDGGPCPGPLCLRNSRAFMCPANAHLYSRFCTLVGGANRLTYRGPDLSNDARTVAELATAFKFGEGNLLM